MSLMSDKKNPYSKPSINNKMLLDVNLDKDVSTALWS